MKTYYCGGSGIASALPVSIGGEFEMTSGTINFETFEVYKLAATVMFGATENYIGASICTRFGAFVVDASIGEGGSVVVYRAHRDGDYAQTVAIKRIAGARLDLLGTRRLQHERDVLAQLDHPGIVRLIDPGVATDGRPYLALEYVDGLTWERHVVETHPDAATRLALERLASDFRNSGSGAGRLAWHGGNQCLRFDHRRRHHRLGDVRGCV